MSSMLPGLGLGATTTKRRLLIVSAHADAMECRMSGTGLHGSAKHALTESLIQFSRVLR